MAEEKNKNDSLEKGKAPRKPPKKEEVNLYEEIKDFDTFTKVKEKFADIVLDGKRIREQHIFYIKNENILDFFKYLRDEEKYDMLADLTAIDYPDREKRFAILYNIYSFKKLERLLVRMDIADGEEVETVSEIWPSANWPEREVYDMFGIKFKNHPDLRRILLPEDWKTHPLRKDFDVKNRDQDWMERHLGIREDVNSGEVK